MFDERDGYNTPQSENPETETKVESTSSSPVEPASSEQPAPSSESHSYGMQEEQTNTQAARPISFGSASSDAQPQQAAQTPPQQTQIPPQNPTGTIPPYRASSQPPHPGYNYSAYEQQQNGASGSKPPKRSNALVITLCACLAVCICALAVIGVLGISGNGIFSGLTGDTQSDGTAGNNSLDITLNSVPERNDTATEGQELTGIQISQKVSPSIVGVLNYASTGRSYEISGQGSGIIISEDGYIVTNQHVIDGAAKVEIIFYDEEGMSMDNSVEAEIVGQDTTTDLALLKVNLTGLTPAELADSDDVKVGETVYAIGNPGGIELSCSITGGMVSGVNRRVGSMNFIQTDAAVNPGNSGGALVNVYGQVIGIISEKITTLSNDVDAEGLSFAIPTATAKPILDSLQQYGYVRGRTALRITVQTVSDTFASLNQVPLSVRVLEVEQGSNAEAAGLRTNDFITHFNGTRVTTTDELAAAKESCEVGDTVTLTVYRYSTGQTVDITFTLEEDQGQ